MKVFRFNEKLGDEYFEVLWYIRNHGKIYENDRNQKYIEAEPILIEVFNPYFGKPSQVLPQYIIQRWGEEFIYQYAENVAYCRPEPGQWSYSYGERLAIKNQLKNVIQKLKRDPHTRQATCVLYLPEDTENPTPPCMCMVDFKIRDGRLNTFAVFRSNDMENAYPVNYFELLLLSYRVATELNVPVGKITTFSISAHIYVW